MDFNLTEEQKSLKALAREFCKKEFPEGPIATWNELISKRNAEGRDKVPWDWIKKLYDAGFKHLTAPEKYGGGGAGALTAFLVSEELARSGGAISIVARQFFGSCEYMACVANEEQQEEFQADYAHHVACDCYRVTQELHHGAEHFKHDEVREAHESYPAVLRVHQHMLVSHQGLDERPLPSITLTRKPGHG